MEKAKRWFVFFCCLCMFLHTNPQVYAEEPANTQCEYHFVVVYDVSGSMLEADQDKQIRNMISLLVDKIRSDMFPVKIAVLPFASDCPAISTLEPPGSAPWWYAESYNSSALIQLKQQVKKLEYTRYDTDIGKALQTCCHVLSEMSKDVDSYTQAVLFITDGLPDLPASTTEDKFRAIYASYEKAMQAAEEFPRDTFFLGIVPDESSRNSVLTYGSGDEITRYYGYNVPKQYREQMYHASQCMQEFSRVLTERQTEGWNYSPEIHEINWQGTEVSNNVDQIYNAFFEKVFHASATEKLQQDLEHGVNFSVPETVSEINITLIPDAKNIQEQQELVQLCTQQLMAACDKGACEPFITDSENAVTVRLIDPVAGDYTLKCAGITSANLRFYAYGSIQIISHDESLEGVLGKEIRFGGRIVNGAQQPLSEASLKYIHLSVTGVDDEGKTITPVTQIHNDGSWDAVFTPEKDGEYKFKLNVSYDDTDLAGFSDGISRFAAQPKQIVVNISASPAFPVIIPAPVMEPVFTRFLKYLSNAGPQLYLGIPSGILVLCMVISRFRRRRFIVQLENGRTVRISVPRRRGVLARTRVANLSVLYNGADDWEYSYNSRGLRRIYNDIIDLQQEQVIEKY